MICKAKVAVKGTSALLMHRYPLEPIEGLDKKKKEEQAEAAAYRDSEGRLYLPGINLQRALVAAATFSKGKGRASLQKQVAACVFIHPEHVDLGRKEYVIDSRAVVIPSTRGRIVRHRPRLDDWKVEFEIEWDDVLIKETEMRKVVDDCGQRIGLLDFRPEKKGPFGRFMVTLWETEEG